MRFFISAAASRVKVSTSIRSTSTGFSPVIISITCCASTAVFPEPAAAATSTVPRESIAHC